jgi:hypothetical protein
MTLAKMPFIFEGEGHGYRLFNFWFSKGVRRDLASLDIKPAP